MGSGKKIINTVKVHICLIRETSMKETGEMGKDMGLVSTYLLTEKYLRDSIVTILGMEKELSTVQTW